MMKDSISKANMDDLQEILNLQYLAYQSEAALFGNKDTLVQKDHLLSLDIQG